MAATRRRGPLRQMMLVRRMRAALAASPRDWVAILALAQAGGRGVVRATYPCGSPLHAAARDAKAGCAALLLALGGEPAAQDRAGWTPLHAAAHAGDTDVVKLLLAAGAHVDGYVRSGYRPTRSTPLAVALAAGHRRVAALLITCGANLKLRDVYGRTPEALARNLLAQKSRRAAGDDPRHGAAKQSTPFPVWRLDEDRGARRRWDPTSGEYVYNSSSGADELSRRGASSHDAVDEGADSLSSYGKYSYFTASSHDACSLPEGEVAAMASKDAEEPEGEAVLPSLTNRAAAALEGEVVSPCLTNGSAAAPDRPRREVLLPAKRHVGMRHRTSERFASPGRRPRSERPGADVQSTAVSQDHSLPRKGILRPFSPSRRPDRDDRHERASVTFTGTGTGTWSSSQHTSSGGQTQPRVKRGSVLRESSASPEQSWRRGSYATPEPSSQRGSCASPEQSWQTGKHQLSRIAAWVLEDVGW